jgi:hypothetical protein
MIENSYWVHNLTLFFTFHKFSDYYNILNMGQYIFHKHTSFFHCLFTHLKWNVMLLELSVSCPLLSLCVAPCKCPTVTSVLNVLHCLIRCEQWFDLLMRNCVLQSVWCILQMFVGLTVAAVLKILCCFIACVQMRGCLVLSVCRMLQAFVSRLHIAKVFKVLHCFITSVQ